MRGFFRKRKGKSWKDGFRATVQETTKVKEGLFKKGGEWWEGKEEERG